MCVRKERVVGWVGGWGVGWCGGGGGGGGVWKLKPAQYLAKSPATSITHICFACFALHLQSRKSKEKEKVLEPRFSITKPFSRA